MVTLRPSCTEDEAFFYQVYASTRAAEMAMTGWADAEQTAFLQMQFAAQRHHYLRHYPAATYHVIVCDGEDIGRLVVEQTVDDILLMDIALLLAYRNAGIGTYLIRCLQAEAAVSNKLLRLHVDIHNPALRLYQRLGFQKIAESSFYWEMVWQANASDASSTSL